MRQELPLDDQLRTAGDLVVRTRVFHDLWWLYAGANTRPTIVGTMNQYSEFFRFDQHAHLVAFIVHMAALFDKRRDVISLHRLVSRFENGGHASPEVISDARAQLAKAQGRVSSMMKLRHKLFAHRSASETYADVFKLASVTPADLRGLTETALLVLNRLLIARGQEERFFAELPLEDAQKVLGTLSAAARQVSTGLA